MALFDPKAKTIAAYTKKIEDNKNAIDKNYYEIGKLYVDQYKDMSLDVTKEINSRCDSVTTLEKDIESLKLSILFEKGLKLCKSCGKENSLVHAFCYACGAKFEEDSVVAPAQPKLEAATSEKTEEKSEDETPETNLFI